MSDPWQVVAIVATLTVSAGYLGLGLFLAPKFDAAAPGWVLRAFKVAGLSFFLLCADTHARLAWHIYDGLLPAAFWRSPHFLVLMVAEAGAASVALLLAYMVIQVRMFDRRYTREMVERMVVEEADLVARTARLKDITVFVAEARRAREAADLILASVHQKKEAGHA